MNKGRITLLTLNKRGQHEVFCLQFTPHLSVGYLSACCCRGRDAASLRADQAPLELILDERASMGFKEGGDAGSLHRRTCQPVVIADHQKSKLPLQTIKSGIAQSCQLIVFAQCQRC